MNTEEISEAVMEKMDELTNGLSQVEFITVLHELRYLVQERIDIVEQEMQGGEE